ncbi:hypothetical protein LWI29_006549 [Acer saccharum]|uniref:MLO-like protein n=1 Tax=Acer saccharum TaxID=4024 RepID=A0AA39RQV2_ACESA|nr:hypothetical protein LWI29_006549 [Acer saccharum]
MTEQTYEIAMNGLYKVIEDVEAHMRGMEVQDLDSSNNQGNTLPTSDGNVMDGKIKGVKTKGRPRDLMLFGFISLLLTVSERRIASICITKSLAETFLPCGTNDSDAYSNEETKCLEQEKVSFLSREGVKQLQFLIFILAFFHSLSSVLTFSLGMAKMLLVVGTKLQGIITQMCLDSHNKSHIVRGTLLVKPSDDLFWFNRPKLVLHLIHFILFQNSFQLAFFTWTWYKFGLRSCFHQETEEIVIRLVLGVVVHILCAYVTLPLYALVTQMGSSMNKAVFTENMVQGLKSWRARARKNLKSNHSPRPSLDTSPSYTLEASFSVYGDPPPPCDNTDYIAVEIGSEEKVAKDQWSIRK